ncbi:MAG: MFS transporter [Flavipsychrobacter sp.]|nr:MFS transporter [Flavipsychrobacter sp.]
MLTNTLLYLRQRSSLSIGYLFAVSSILLGIWVAAIPQVKQRLNLTDATLGLTLLLAPLGALTGVALAPWFFKRVAVGNWMFYGSLFYCAAFILQVTAPGIPVLMVALFLTGLTGFLNGVSTNAMVDQLEQKLNRRLMSTSHGMYSLGGGISAGLASFFYWLQLSAVWQIGIVAMALATGLVLLRNDLLSHKVEITSDSRFKLPSGGVVGLSFICFVTFMGEGCVADWSALYLRESLNGTKAIAGIGFAGFSIAMALGRFNGDTLIPKIGNKKVVITGCLLAATGYLLAVSFASIPLAIAGFTLVGLGFSCVVPVLFSTATKVPGVSAVSGISAVATGGLMGFLAGPSLIGIISEKFSMAIGLSVIFILAVLAAVTAWKNRYLQNKTIASPQVNYPDQLL